MTDKTGGSGIAEKARLLAMPYAESLGLTLWDVRFIKEGAEWYLIYYIDKPGGIVITDCEDLSRAVDEPLDEADFIGVSYHLQVSSPGLGRRLTRPEHFELMQGEAVTVRFIHAESGVKEIVGTLQNYKEHTLFLLDEYENVSEIPKAKIAFVKLNDDIFDTDTEE